MAAYNIIHIGNALVNKLANRIPYHIIVLLIRLRSEGTVRGPVTDDYPAQLIRTSL